MTRSQGLGLAATAAVMALAVLAGCGSVANVGTGASQSSIAPVSGAYSYSGYGMGTAGAPVTDTQLRDQGQKASSTARVNQVPDNKTTAAVVRDIKAQPRATSDATPKVAADTAPTLDPAAKTTVVSQEQGLAQAAPSSAVQRPPGLGGQY